MNANNITPSIFDTGALANVKRLAKNNDPAGIKAAAQQFEALFLQMMLKSMRDATPHDGLLDSDQTRLYESLLDQQLSQVLATRGSTGLAKIIEGQLSRYGVSDASTPEAATQALPASLRSIPVRPTLDALSALAVPQDVLPDRVTTTSRPAGLLSSADALPTVPADASTTVTAPVDRFVERMWPHAQAASQTTGIPARFLIAQAALETGWGKSEPKLADGQPSYNLFGIKAGSSWRGRVAEATTTEYVGGVAQQKVERFRAYGSYAEAFQDYAALIAGNPRYAQVVGSQDAASFAQGLARAGYATDPNYAQKLSKVINTLAS